MTAAPLSIELWSDVACPWCWLGKRHLDLALAQAALPAPPVVRFRSYELSPDHRGVEPVEAYLARKTGDPGYARRAHARLAEMGARVGLRYDFERALHASTFDAHRVHHLAQERGVGSAVMDRLMRARHAEGADVSDHATLVRLAAEAGLDAGEAQRVLASDAFAADVRADERRAAEHAIAGVPFFVFDGRYGVSGAQPVEALAGVLRRLDAERAAAARA